MRPGHLHPRRTTGRSAPSSIRIEFLVPWHNFDRSGSRRGIGDANGNRAGRHLQYCASGIGRPRGACASGRVTALHLLGGASAVGGYYTKRTWWARNDIDNELVAAPDSGTRFCRWA